MDKTQPEYQSNKVAKIRNRYNQVPHLTQNTNGKVTNSQKTPQTRAKRSAGQSSARIPGQNAPIILGQNDLYPPPQQRKREKRTNVMLYQDKTLPKYRDNR